MKKIILMVCLLCAAATGVMAQKYGHLNYGNALVLIPEVKEADAQLEAFQKDLVAKGERMALEFRGNVAKFVTEQQSGLLSPKELQSRREVLQKQQEAIETYEQEVEEKVNAKREELLRPLTEKLDVLIEEVAKANQFTLVFDTSAFNAVLYGADNVDLLPLIKAKLGVK